MWRTKNGENGETARDRLKGTKLIYHYDSGLPHPFPPPYALKAVTRNIQANVYTRHKSYTNIETERTKRQKKREWGGERRLSSGNRRFAALQQNMGK
jgi:hypothetical protein